MIKLMLFMCVLLNIFLRPSFWTCSVSEECDELTSDEEKRAKQLEIEAVQAAERGQLDDAIKLFDEAISLAPTRATCYNNRAQALRLKGDVSSKFMYSAKIYIRFPTFVCVPLNI